MFPDLDAGQPFALSLRGQEERTETNRMKMYIFHFMLFVGPSNCTSAAT